MPVERYRLGPATSDERVQTAFDPAAGSPGGAGRPRWQRTSPLPPDKATADTLGIRFAKGVR
jgi:hypothetical protein